MSELVPGGNVPLPHGTLTFRVPGPFDLSVLVTGDDGRVRDDGDFVFWNQPSAPGVRLGTAAVTLDRQGLRPGAGRVTLVVSSSSPGTPLSRLPSPRMEVADLSNRTLTRFHTASGGTGERSAAGRGLPPPRCVEAACPRPGVRGRPRGRGT